MLITDPYIVPRSMSSCCTFSPLRAFDVYAGEDFTLLFTNFVYRDPMNLQNKDNIEDQARLWKSDFEISTKIKFPNL